MLAKLAGPGWLIGDGHIPRSLWIPASYTRGTTRCLYFAHLKVHIEVCLVVAGPGHAGLCGGMVGDGDEVWVVSWEFSNLDATTLSPHVPGWKCAQLLRVPCPYHPPGPFQRRFQARFHAFYLARGMVSCVQATPRGLDMVVPSGVSHDFARHGTPATPCVLNTEHLLCARQVPTQATMQDIFLNTFNTFNTFKVSKKSTRGSGHGKSLLLGKRVAHVHKSRQRQAERVCAWHG